MGGCLGVRTCGHAANIGARVVSRGEDQVVVAGSELGVCLGFPILGVVAQAYEGWWGPSYGLRAQRRLGQEGVEGASGPASCWAVAVS